MAAAGWLRRPLSIVEPRSAAPCDTGPKTSRLPAGHTWVMTLVGRYEPSSLSWVRAEVEQIEATGGAAFSDRRVVVLSTLGARTGLLRKTPLMRVEHAGTYAVIASMAGADRHPQWYANVRAHPQVALRDGALLLDLAAREATGEERARWWSRACTTFPAYARYQRLTRRRIPLLLLEADAPGQRSSR